MQITIAKNKKIILYLQCRFFSANGLCSLTDCSMRKYSNFSAAKWKIEENLQINPYPTAFPYGNGMVLHFYQQQESSTTKTVHKVINKGLKAYV